MERDLREKYQRYLWEANNLKILISLCKKLIKINLLLRNMKKNNSSSNC